MCTVFSFHHPSPGQYTARIEKPGPCSSTKKTLVRNDARQTRNIIPSSITHHESGQSSQTQTMLAVIQLLSHADFGQSPRLSYTRVGPLLWQSTTDRRRGDILQEAAQQDTKGKQKTVGVMMLSPCTTDSNYFVQKRDCSDAIPGTTGNIIPLYFQLVYSQKRGCSFSVAKMTTLIPSTLVCLQKRQCNFIGVNEKKRMKNME